MASTVTIPPPEGARFVVGTIDEFNEASTHALEGGKAGIERLKTLAKEEKWSEKSTLDFDSVLSALEIYDEATALLGNASARASVVRESHPEEAFRTAAEKREQELEQLATEISLDRGIYDALQTLSSFGAGSFDPSTRHFLDRTLKDFKRAGVDRDEATRTRVKELNEELVRIGQEFGRNIRDDVRSILVEAKDLEGLPEDYVRSHKADENGKIKITTDSPDYIPFVTYSKSNSAREALWRTYRQRGHPKNFEVLQKLISKRHELATLLGYRSWAQYITENKMIKTEKNAAEFIEKISQASGERMKHDYEDLLARKKKDEPDAAVVNPWDLTYLEDRIRAEEYAFDSQSVRPYFEYSRVKQGVFDINSQLFGISFSRVSDAKVWHPEVEAYDLLEEGKLVGRFYLDMHPRENKYKHAAQFTLVTGKANALYPEAVLMCNFPKPPSDPTGEPALMQHGDVETFFHEFGHLLHHILGGHTRWAGLSGVRTEWDFVETPSQMLEEWTKDVEVLQKFAKHYQTNEPIPADFVKKLKAADDFGKGIYVRQQMFYAAISLSFYNRESGEDFDTTSVVKELQEKYTPFKFVDQTYFHLSFGHLDGYSAIYYTYMWSLVIAKDLFEVFEKEGLLNGEVAKKYRSSVLEPGGSKDAALLVKDFLGREYSFDAYQRWLNAGARH